MAITRVSIVYSAAQEVIRSITHFDRVADHIVKKKWRMMTPEEIEDFDEEKALAARLAILLPGESHVTIPQAEYHAIKTHEAIHTYLGLKGIPYVTDRHVSIHPNGYVSDVHLCDPLIDCPNGIWRNTELRAKVGGHLLLQHADANAGDQLMASPQARSPLMLLEKRPNLSFSAAVLKVAPRLLAA